MPGLLSGAMRKLMDLLLDDDLKRRIEALKKNTNEFGVDPFGFSPDTLRYAVPLVRWIYTHYFRVQAYGVERVPTEGPVMLVANHAGQIPLDGMMIGAAMFLEPREPRIVRSMVERWVPSLPFVSTFFSRVGQILGLPDNCRRLLASDEAILVFPEGVKGISKTFDKRYQLQDFGYGFMRLAIENHTPIVPVAVIGSEEQAPAIYNWRSLGKLFGMPAFPITPTFPLVPVVGMLPYPVKYRIHFGEPLSFDGDPHDEDAAIAKHVERVRSSLNNLIRRGLAQRRAVFW